MKEVLKDKKKIIIIIALLIVVLVGVLIICLSTKKDQNNKLKDPIIHEQNYVMYVKINPLVKLNYKETYKEFFNESNEKYICEENKTFVTDYKLLNNDAKKMYYDLDIKNQDLYDVITMLCDVAKDNNIDFSSFEITSDNKDFDKEFVKNTIKNKSKYNLLLDINYNYEEVVNEDNILDKEDEKEEKIYVVYFDTDGGSKINNQLLKENEKVTKPQDPTKNGYSFEKWVVDNEVYDFDKPISSDITIKAIWKSNNKNSNNDNNVSNNNENNSNNNSNNNNSSNNDQPPFPEVPCYVNFDVVRASEPVPTTQKLKCGQKATRPQDPKVEGYEFIEWQLNGKTFDFNTAVNDSITLKAVWKKIEINLPKPTNLYYSNATCIGCGIGHDITEFFGVLTYNTTDKADDVQIMCSHQKNGTYTTCGIDDGTNRYGKNYVKMFSTDTYYKIRYVYTKSSNYVYSEYSEPLFVPGVTNRVVTAKKVDGILVITNAENLKYDIYDITDSGYSKKNLVPYSGNKTLNYQDKNFKVIIHSVFEGNGYKVISNAVEVR